MPAEIVLRRYWAGLMNMRNLYLPLADIVAIYDNSDAGRILIAEKLEGSRFVVLDGNRWTSIEGAGR